MRIGGVNVPVGKRVVIALTYIYGVGPSRAKVICDACAISPGIRVSELSDDEVSYIRDYIRSNYVIEADLRKEVSVNIKRLIDMNCYRGIRHRRGLPVRGQRTHTNAKTRKGRGRLAVAARK